MSKNSVSFRFGVSGPEKYSLRGSIILELKRRGFIKKTIALWNHVDMSPKEISETMIKIIHLQDLYSGRAKVSSFEVNAYRDFMMRAFYGLMRK